MLVRIRIGRDLGLPFSLPSWVFLGASETDLFAAEGINTSIQSTRGNLLKNPVSLKAASYPISRIINYPKKICLRLEIFLRGYT